MPYDGVDQDCDGVDNLDADDDGFDSNAHGGNDCNDTVGSIYPGAPEVAKDGIDQDCDGEDSLDADLDGHDDAA
ncbi:MAG: MopE-related protein [bacterium]